MEKTNKSLNALRNRSESEALEQKNKLASSERSLPRGEYYSHIMGPKLNKTSNKFEAVKHIKVSGDKGEEDNCLEDSTLDFKSQQDEFDESPQKTESGFSTPKQTPSTFTPKGGVSLIKKSFEKKNDEKVMPKDFGKPFYTPVVSRRNHQELYRQTLLTNIALGIKQTENKVTEPSNESYESLNPPGSVQIKPITKKLKHSDTLQINRILQGEDKSIAIHTNYIFGPVFDEKTVSRHLDLIKRGLYYSINLLKAPAKSYIDSRQIELKEDSTAKKTLILDLDETLSELNRSFP